MPKRLKTIVKSNADADIAKEMEANRTVIELYRADKGHTLNPCKA